MRTFFANFDDFLKVEFNLFHTLISGRKIQLQIPLRLTITQSMFYTDIVTGKVESGKNPQIHRNQDITSTFI